MARRLDLVDDAAQPAPLVVPQALGDAEGARVRNQDGEAPGQGDLLGEPGALGADGVLGDLAEDGLARLEDVLDPGLLGGSALDVLPVVAHVAPVEDRVLRDADVDEGGLHARQDVLDPAPVDIAVDLIGVVGRAGDEVLHQGAPLEHGDLGHFGLHVDADQVPAHLLGTSFPPVAARSPAAARALGPALAFRCSSVCGARPAGLLAGAFRPDGAFWPRERHHGGRRLRLRRGCGPDGRRHGWRWSGVPDLGFRCSGDPRPVRGTGAAAPRSLRGETLRVADFRLGHEG